MSSQEYRQELANFLRTRRERISPADVGLPIGRRRRTRGLRREEVAVLAGLSPTWYTYLEQARNIHPSPEVLDSLARVLALSEDERRYLHQLAAGNAPAVSAEGVEPDMSLITALVRHAGRGPYPVYALNHAGDVIAWNDAATRWYTDWGARDGLDRNMLWWMLTSEEARERVVDWADDARDITARSRAMAARHPGDRKVTHVINHLLEASPEFRRWWADFEVRGQQARPRRLRHPAFGELTTQLAVVHPTDGSLVTIAFHLPYSDDHRD
ncbi:helix-turn-helix transcriptional regulator [Micromonospora sp. WMMD1102]|uniref:helix-turn-helix transcriptional regulator n=1 Tax=Micromonospora sp. WMMD1102 TaxID=3016105 RepID=UPI0024150611|nr:helix-turn-helix transcriptional regulator [Micromonospora sp. WMMD1102]MDG4789573.1 helix-turn-helix transcriptional regulator [Micromonospora sp. WMMD1102]